MKKIKRFLKNDLNVMGGEVIEIKTVKRGKIIKYIYYSPEILLIILSVFKLIELLNSIVIVKRSYIYLFFFLLVLSYSKYFFQKFFYEKTGYIEFSFSKIKIVQENLISLDIVVQEIEKITVVSNNYREWVTFGAFYRATGLGNKVEILVSNKIYSYNFLLENVEKYFALKRIVLEWSMIGVNIDYYEKGKKMCLN